jgi:hypothetical protein
MAVGSVSDFTNRLYSTLPTGWFPNLSNAPVLNAVLTGGATVLAWGYSAVQFVIAQSRITTATGFFLDQISLEYFGFNLLRKPSETDSAFSARIRANLLQPKGTRPAIVTAITNLTGSAPAIFEPANTGDTGGYGTGHALVWSGLAYGMAGGYGSLALPGQTFVTAYRPKGQGIANVDGYGGYLGGYGVGAIEYTNPSMNTSVATDSNIYAAIAATQPAGYICWTRITTH